jgi:hypothetical protein
VPQAIERELETETFTRKKALPADLQLDPGALQWFTGDPFPAGWGKTHYSCVRCELNAFSADGLAAFIEAGLRAHGAATKLVPPADVLAADVHNIRDAQLHELVMGELLRKVNVDDVVAQLVADNPDLGDVGEADVRAMLAEQPAISWRSSVSRLVRADIADADDLGETIRGQIAEQLRAPEGGDTEAGDTS